MTTPTTSCPSCGKPAGGKFCRHCGATTGADRCGRCGGSLAKGARFCSQCGNATAATGGAPGRNERVLWFVAGGLAASLIGGLALGLSRGRTAEPVAVASAAEAPVAAPDISNLSPRERFDRLFNRIMRAAESGDANTVTTFAPMAVQAYAMLETRDADARYHLALIQLHTGEVDAARAQGDSILKAQPGHLFGYVVKGTIARFQKDDKALAKSYSDFLSHYDAEQAAKRPEYQEHPRALEDFLRAARESKGASGS